MRWLNGSTWENVPTAALHGTYRGTLHVEYPAANDRDGLGRPCGAIGRPQIIIESPVMTESGMSFWQQRFANVNATYASISVEVYDTRSGATVRYSGLLHRPMFSGVSSSASTKLYDNVRIVISQCQVIT